MILIFFNMIIFLIINTITAIYGFKITLIDYIKYLTIIINL